jgi:hypothetical protein
MTPHNHFQRGYGTMTTDFTSSSICCHTTNTVQQIKIICKLLKRRMAGLFNKITLLHFETGIFKFTQRNNHTT